MGIVAALLGALGPRSWWRGLALLAVITGLGTALGIALRLQSDPQAARGHGVPMQDALLSYAITFGLALIWYWIGVAVRLIVRRAIQWHRGAPPPP